MSCFFFFQAEDGIRDYKVTGVQTCALPICGTAGGDERLVRSAASPSHCGIARRARAIHDGRGETEGQERGPGRPRGPLRHSESPLESIGASRAHRALTTRTRAPSCRSVGGLITMCAPWVSPPVTSTQLPRSRPTVTV